MHLRTGGRIAAAHTSDFALLLLCCEWAADDACRQERVSEAARLGAVGILCCFAAGTSARVRLLQAAALGSKHVLDGSGAAWAEHVRVAVRAALGNGREHEVGPAVVLARVARRPLQSTAGQRRVGAEAAGVRCPNVVPKLAVADMRWKREGVGVSENNVKQKNNPPSNKV